MIDKSEALFVVRLPFGQKTIPYEEVTKLIAMAKFPGYDLESASEAEDVIFILEIGFEDKHLRAAILAGKVEVLNKSLHRMSPPYIGRLENTVLTVRALREYVESINGFLEVDDAPEPQATPIDNETEKARIPQSFHPQQGNTQPVSVLMSGGAGWGRAMNALETDAFSASASRARAFCQP